ncbi:hypothetical protein PCC8801_0534 [Rippkaea orientalis PCC 8801]|uniref:Uncharacterized protein n=1 Tax=Rippkaea orientalis (strain PCC 8801 / RF-1) TaxID=41431 RepID=B7JVQ4_RIPO1|nr:hypothetical protein PCC8801_0534 [Rippkaea orientalis PCC 8801]
MGQIWYELSTVKDCLVTYFLLYLCPNRTLSPQATLFNHLAKIACHCQNSW